MKRVQLFELMDFEWFPKFTRDLITDVLYSMASKESFFTQIIPVVKKVMAKTNSNQIVDLCSGAGGPWLSMIDEVQEENKSIKLTFTDKFPNKESAERVSKDFIGQVEYYRESVDAAEVPSNLTGVRTIFGGFHHMNPTVATNILKNAAEKREGIVVGEVMLMPPTFAWITLPILLLLSPLFLIFYWFHFAKVMKGKPLTVMGRLLITYLIPIAPLVMMFDTFISIVRVYTKDELKQITDTIQVEGYTWEVDMVKMEKNGPPVVYVAGYPNENLIVRGE
ncbi:hypothetical protein [Ornithinibacillus scapharcae]|uniref:hypothetical protein n=1 Tax=Ornithinibacillus scapharcae TaxID=1147159 RepID=UPI000225B03A|nr:hypothetical protein [Ornithinibacillus scapharcae]